jgi:calpain-9
MSFSDWLRTFSQIEVVHLDADTARDEPSLTGKNPWTLRLYHGRWQKGVSAGGCRNNVETFHMNPQLSISLAEADEVILALNQHTATDPKVIGFTGYPENTNAGDSTLDQQQHGKSYFKSRKSLLNSQYTNSRQVSLRKSLDRGQILVLPTTYEPGEEATFTFRVFSRSPVRIRIVDVVPSVTGNVFARARQPNAGPPISSSSTNNNNKLKDFSQYEPLFNQVSDERRTINSFELQDLLETCLPNGEQILIPNSGYHPTIISPCI